MRIAGVAMPSPLSKRGPFQRLHRDEPGSGTGQLQRPKKHLKSTHMHASLGVEVQPKRVAISTLRGARSLSGRVLVLPLHIAAGLRDKRAFLRKLRAATEE